MEGLRSGQLGENLVWSFVPETGRLTVEGIGAMPEFYGDNPAPWWGFRDEIRKVVIGEGITKVSEHAFEQSVNLTEISLPGTVEVLGFYCFMECTAMTEVRIPEGVRIINFQAFAGCTSLERIYLPLSLEAIDKKAFRNCNAWKEVVYAGTEDAWNKIRISYMHDANVPFSKAPRRYEGKVSARRASKPIDTWWFRERRETVPVQDMVADIIDRGGDGRFHVFVKEMLNHPGDVEQVSDFLLLVFPDGKIMMIDNGRPDLEDKVINALHRMHVKRVDYMLSSHFHVDHIGNSIAVEQYLREQGGGLGEFMHIGVIAGKCIPGVVRYLEENRIPIRDDLRDGDEMEIDRVKMQIFWPTNEFIDKADLHDAGIANPLSVVSKFTFGKSTFMTSGDLHRAEERETVKLYGEMLKADVMKFNHHGSGTSNCDEWIQAISPKFSFVSTVDVGSTELMEKMENRGVVFWSSGINGDILVSMDADGNIEAKTAFGEEWTNQ